MLYGYGRCSTNELRQDISRQTRELVAMGVAKENIYTEYESGTKEDRIQLNRLLQVVSSGDTICCCEVSRITRSMKQLIEILELAKEKKLRLVLGTFTVDFRTDQPDSMTLATIQLMGVFAELERNMISDRVSSGMANAKAKGKQIGRKIVTVNEIPDYFVTCYHKYYKNTLMSKQELGKLAGFSYPTTLKYIKLLLKKMTN